MVCSFNIHGSSWMCIEGGRWLVIRSSIVNCFHFLLEQNRWRSTSRRYSPIVEVLPGIQSIPFPTKSSHRRSYLTLKRFLAEQFSKLLQPPLNLSPLPILLAGDNTCSPQTVRMTISFLSARYVTTNATVCDGVRPLMDRIMIRHWVPAWLASQHMIGIWLLAACFVNQTDVSKFVPTPALAQSLAKNSFSAALVGSALSLQINDTTHTMIPTS